MTFKPLFVSALACLSLTACTTVKGPSDDGVTVSFKNETGKAFVAGFQPVSVRAAQGQKSVPATCKITSDKFASPSFQSPAKVNLPAYSNGAVRVTLTCTYNDETKAVSVAPENLSAKARAGSAIGVALLCPICGVGVAAAGAAKNKDNDIYGFTNLDIALD